MLLLQSLPSKATLVCVSILGVSVSVEDLTEEKVSVGAEDEGVCDSCEGPRVARTTGKTTSPWYNPNTAINVKALKVVKRTCPVENDPSSRARKVVRPPLRTAGPMVIRALMVLSSLSPGSSSYLRHET